MFLGILSTAFNSLATIFWKKALWLSSSLSPRVFALFASAWPIVLVTYFSLFWKYNFLSFDYKILLIIILISSLYFINVQISQYVYKREKISVLTPYENLNKIFSITLAFFIFSDVSVLSFLLTLFAWFIITAASIDFKTFKIPKLIKVFSVWQIFKSITILLIWYVLKKITSIDYYIIYSLLYASILMLIVISKWEFSDITKFPKKFYIARFSASSCWALANIINFSIISSLWVTISILFSYFYIWFILILSYIFFWDKPTRKNIILTMILAILVWLEYYFK